MQKSTKSTVVITHAPRLDYLRDYVSLPANFGSDQYEVREDVVAIRETVFRNLTALDEKVHFSSVLRGRQVLIKPNLVTVFHELGMQERDYPESTDPRVLDAVGVISAAIHP